MLKKFIYFLILILNAGSLFANGGPVGWTDTTPVGAIALKDSENFTLKKETLKIKVLNLNEYSVDAVYELHGNKSEKIKFGVPLYWYDMDDDDDLNSSVNQVPSKKILASVQKISKSISIVVNGKKVRCSPVYRKAEFSLIRGADRKFGDIIFIKAWCTADLKLKSGSNQIYLQYRANMDFEDLQFSKSALTVFSERKLEYLLYPAGFWNQNVSELLVSVDPGIYDGFVTSVSPAKFKKIGQEYKWQGKNIDFKKLPSIEF
ncbi:MAG: hypothetical protein OEZ34_06920, partial [Spirochaetia bacterium]|nr:hypothetical protein [Spirochaetia bacterium]